MESLLDDARLAARSLRRRGRAPLLIALTLAVGIACTTAMFSVVRGVLLEPLPWPESDRMAMVWNRPPGNADRIGLSMAELHDLEEMVTGIRVGTYSTNAIPLDLGDHEETARVSYVTRETMALLGVEPVLGRGFTDEEFVYGGPRKVILSHAAWQRLYGGDRGALGRSLTFRGHPHEVIGVMAPGMALPLEVGGGEDGSHRRSPEIVRSLRADPAQHPFVQEQPS